MRRFLSLLAVIMVLIPTASAIGDVKIIDFSVTNTNGTVPLHVYFTGNVNIIIRINSNICGFTRLISRNP